MPRSAHSSSSRSTPRHHRRHTPGATGPLVGILALFALLVAGLYVLFTFGE